MRTIPSRTTIPRAAALLLAGLLAACAGGHHVYYGAAGPHQYNAPGPPDDPWGPYITEAAARFSVPATWIRQVMRQESGGHQYLNGSLTTSSAGAMGLMQVIPSTYDMLRQRYGLGDDPYEPHDNILAGTAYIREMYDRYGSPGFLAAYNAGPQRLDSYLAGGSSLPNETVNYLASIAPRLGTEVAMTGPLAVYGGSGALYGGTAAQLAAYTPPPTYTTAAAAPPVTLPVVATPASAPAAWQQDGAQDGPIRAEFIPDPAPDPVPVPPPAPVPAPMPAVLRTGWQQGAPYAATPSPYAPPPVPPMPFQRTADSQRFRLVGTVAPGTYGALAGIWAVQVGAFSDPRQAREAAEQARSASRELAGAAVQIGATTRPDGATLYRARLSGLSGDAAATACGRLTQAGIGCLTVPPA